MFGFLITTVNILVVYFMEIKFFIHNFKNCVIQNLYQKKTLVYLFVGMDQSSLFVIML